MRFRVVCPTCRETFWIRGTYESDTNATVLDDNDPNWSDACSHVLNGGDYDTDDWSYIDED